MTAMDPEPIEGLDFEALRECALARVQELSSDLWTDYNVHDPGVTILEQFCYALTEIVHRIDFDVADLLTGRDARIAYEELALAPPEKVFPCRPTTPSDYRRALLDDLPELDNVWIEPLSPPCEAAAHVEGLYVARVRRAAETGASDEALRERVFARFAPLRNLCEDLEAVDVIRETPCDLHASIVLENADDPAGVLARVFETCTRIVAGTVRLRPFEEMRREGQTLERLFRGPLGEYGFCDEEDLARGEKTLSTSELYARIREIEGVGSVRSLSLRRSENAEPIPLDGSAGALRLRVPEEEGELRVELLHAGRRVAVDLRELAARFHELTLLRMGTGRVRQSASKLYHLPSGGPQRPFGEWVSIQTQLPVAYGVGVEGVPSSAPPERRARARQLRGYLLLFDQLMANCVANLPALRELFSPSLEKRRSYAPASLEGSGIPELEALFREGHVDDTAGILARYDDFFERKSRVLDYLLALHGDAFSATPMQMKEGSGSTLDAGEESRLVRKAAFLRDIVEISQDRGAGATFDDGSFRPSGLAVRLGHLLGVRTDALPPPDTSPATGLHFASAEEERDRVSRGAGWRHAEEEGARDAEPLSPEPDADGDAPLETLLRHWGEILPLGERIVGPETLRRGMRPESYRIGRIEPEPGEAEPGDAETGWRIYFEVGDDHWHFLGGFATRQAAREAAVGLLRLSRALDGELKGLHVVEHVLLRPRAPGSRRDPEIAVRCSLRLTVVLPGWGERYENESFRRLAWERVKESCPAHLAPAIAWLDLPQMQRFLTAYGRWLGRWAACGARAVPELDTAARELLDLLEAATAGADAA